MKSKPGEDIPGAPLDDKQLGHMIDAPLGDRTSWTPEWPPLEEYYVPIGEARVVRDGTHVTVPTYGRNVPMAIAAADELGRGSGVETEVIDLRSLHPYDWDAIVRRASARPTASLCVNEDTEITNFGEHLIRRIGDELFYELHAPPKLVAGAAIPGIGLADISRWRASRRRTASRPRSLISPRTSRSWPYVRSTRAGNPTSRHSASSAHLTGFCRGPTASTCGLNAVRELARSLYSARRICGRLRLA